MQLVGIGYDVHQLTAGRKLILGGVEIPHSKGLDGHSDADALSSRAQMQESLNHAHLAVAARFPMLWLSARQIADLVPGKVLHTGQASDQPVEVLVNERLRFVGSLGQSRGHLGIRIVDRIQKPVAARPVQFKQGRVM